MKTTFDKIRTLLNQDNMVIPKDIEANNYINILQKKYLA
jgi:hypothetical protein